MFAQELLDAYLAASPLDASEFCPQRLGLGGQDSTAQHLQNHCMATFNFPRSLEMQFACPCQAACPSIPAGELESAFIWLAYLGTTHSEISMSSVAAVGARAACSFGVLIPKQRGRVAVHGLADAGGMRQPNRPESASRGTIAPHAHNDGSVRSSFSGLGPALQSPVCKFVSSLFILEVFSTQKGSKKRSRFSNAS